MALGYEHDVSPFRSRDWPRSFKPRPGIAHPHGPGDRNFASPFILDESSIFNSRGYSRLIHRLSYRRPPNPPGYVQLNRIERYMTEPSKDLGIATALMTTFTTQRLPRVLGLRQKVERGERLEDWDIEFLHEVFEGAGQMKPMVDRLPEFQEIYARATLLYREITEKALDNEKGPNGVG